MAATGATLPTPLRTPLLDAHEGETIVFEATLLREPFESSQRSSYLVLLGPLLQCMCYPCAKRQARKVADSWRFYVTEETLCFYLVQRNLYGCSFPQEKRIALADIERVGANDEIEYNCCGLTECQCKAGINTVVVTLKKERAMFYKRFGRQLSFYFVENAEEFAEAVSRQMAMP